MVKEVTDPAKIYLLDPKDRSKNEQKTLKKAVEDQKRGRKS